MGKKPLVGVVGSLCLGLGLAGCESSGQKPVYQGQTGNARNLVSGSPQTTPQPALQPAPPPTSTAQSTQPAWATQPRAASSTATQPYGTSTMAPMPPGPASNAGIVVPTSGMDNSKGYPPPVSTGAPGPMSMNSAPMTGPSSNPTILQTSGTAPSMDLTQQSILPISSHPTSSLATTSQRTTDSYGNSTLPPATSGSRTLPPPPPISNSISSISPTASSLPPVAPPAGDNPALLAPPPGVSNLPPTNELPPSPASIQAPPLPGK